jgi:sporulation protein YlmC with PRC-barrel domain
MQVFPQQLTGLPVISLQSGERIGLTTKLVIDPGKLVIVALTCAVGKTSLLLLPQDIRQLAPQGILVDSEEALAELGDIVRVAPLAEQNWSPIGIKVVTDMGRSVGKVETYTIAPDQFVVQKLHVRRPVWQSLTGASVIIDRNQVLDVTDNQIVVRDTELIAGAVAPAADLPH